MAIFKMPSLLLYFIAASVFILKISSGTGFISLTKCRTFVDKSPLIKEILKTNSTILISTPRGFGKTTNLMMLNSYLSIPVDANGTLVNPNETETHSVFKKLKLYSEAMFFQHFGKHPVLYLDLSWDAPLNNVTSCVHVFREKIHHCFRRHEYLVNSVVLSEEQRRACRSWINARTYKTLSDFEVHTGLRELAKYLYLHFNRSVVLLVDEFDAFVTNTMFKAPEQEIINIVELIVGKLSPLLKPNDHIGRAVVTGESYFEAVGLFDFSYLKAFRFLEDHPLADYYGFTKREVSFIFKRFKINSGTAKEAYSWSGGYYLMKGKELFNPKFVSDFVTSSGDIKHRFKSNETVPLLDLAVKVPQVRDVLLELYKKQAVPINFVEQIWVNELLVLRYLNQHQGDVATKVYLSFLFERGYLAFSKSNSSCASFPNLKVRTAFESKIELYLI